MGRYHPHPPAPTNAPVTEKTALAAIDGKVVRFNKHWSVEAQQSQVDYLAKASPEQLKADRAVTAAEATATAGNIQLQVRHETLKAGLAMIDATLINRGLVEPAEVKKSRGIER